jgi:putative transposase
MTVRRLHVQCVRKQVAKAITALQIIVSDGFRFCGGLFRSRAALAAENLFLRKQLALFQEREKKAKATTAADRFVFSKLSRFFDWRNALVIVKPATLIGWHRAAFRRFWRWKSRPVGRPLVPVEVRRLIRRMAAENQTWGEERIADELFLKLQIRLSPRTVGKYVRRFPRPRGSNDQRWAMFLRNHARGIVACDFFVSVTATFRIVYVFVALEIGSRRLVHLCLSGCFSRPQAIVWGHGEAAVSEEFARISIEIRRRGGLPAILGCLPLAGRLCVPALWQPTRL